MRNYDGYRIGDREFRKKPQTACDNRCFERNQTSCRDNKKLIVEENTIYEIDLDCMECPDKKK